MAEAMGGGGAAAAPAAAAAAPAAASAVSCSPFAWLLTWVMVSLTAHKWQLRPAHYMRAQVRASIAPSLSLKSRLPAGGSRPTTAARPSTAAPAGGAAAPKKAAAGECKHSVRSTRLCYFLSHTHLL